MAITKEWTASLLWRYPLVILKTVADPRITKGLARSMGKKVVETITIKG